MSTFATGKKEVEFLGQKIPHIIKLYDDDYQLHLGKGTIAIFSKVAELVDGKIVVHEDPNDTATLAMEKISPDLALKSNPEGTEFITFKQVFQAICDLTDKVWKGEFVETVPVE